MVFRQGFSARRTIAISRSVRPQERKAQLSKAVRGLGEWEDVRLWLDRYHYGGNMIGDMIGDIIYIYIYIWLEYYGNIMDNYIFRWW